eukprot:CAMPEP_0177684426 /NCGR_PEP_ID=MMETSP0447-20121125/32436_1 /TAXON_ID=0 /ORGANISM="Stygamoeba regulata, Strain BSH-02190019" /LENGTH=89 /DNA_ID=CAMNT_0019194295 /DNA_START=971 /DNA_END=1240 /DNA_ORIENTATION=+
MKATSTTPVSEATSTTGKLHAVWRGWIASVAQSGVAYAGTTGDCVRKGCMAVLLQSTGGALCGLPAMEPLHHPAEPPTPALPNGQTRVP